MRNLVGQQIGPYKIEQLIGAGGMADVYRAHQANLDRFVAIKVLKASLADDPEFVARFSREAMAAGGLRHPNILRIYDAGTHEDRHYIVMDYASGGTLAQRVQQQPLSIDEAAQLGIQIAEALDYAHKRPHPIVHRDLKPSNILLDENRPLLADFGIAYMVSTETRLTQTGTSLGTPEYMSPEQSEGLPVDGRTDIYSLGVILFQLVTGRVPFEAGTPVATMHKVVYTPPPLPREFRGDVPEWMESVILRALAKRPADRFATAGEMAEALRKREVVQLAAASPGEGVGLTQVAPHVKRAPPATVTSKGPPGVGGPGGEVAANGRTPKVAVLVVAALAVVGGAAYLGLSSLSGHADTRQPTPQSAAAQLAELTTATTSIGRPTTAPPRKRTPGRPRQTRTPGPALLQSAIAHRLPGEVTGASPTRPALAAAAVQPANTALPPTSAAPLPTSAPALPTSTTQPPTSTLPLPSSTPPLPTSTTAASASPSVAVAVPAALAPQPAVAPAAPGIVLDFESSLGIWQVGDQPYGTLTQSSEQTHGGQYSAKLAYDFPVVDNEYVVFLNRSGVVLPGTPAALTLWVYGDGSGHFLNVWLQDSAGQVRQFTFGRVTQHGWQQMTAPIDPAAPWPQGHISGPASGQLVYPLSLDALVLDAVPHNAGPFKGAIYLDDLATADNATGISMAEPPASAGLDGTPTAKAPGKP
jgi:hypothetical protein